MRPFGAALAVLCSLFTSTGWARAQGATYVEHRVADGQKVQFDDDPLAALAGAPVGAQITGFHPPRRYELMRPRTTFVPELLKAIEHL